MSKKVLIIANNSDGLYRFRNELIKELTKDNEIIILTPFDRFIPELRNLGCKLIEMSFDRRGINPLKDIQLLKRYIKIVKKENPDLIITYTIKPNIYGGIAARLARKKYVVNITGLGTAFENPGIIRAIVVKLYKFSLKNAKVIFFENINDRDKLVSFGCCKGEKTVVLNGAGVNTKTYSYQSYPKNDEVKFLFVGRVMKEKGVDELFEAMKRLVADGWQCFLDVVGPFEENYKDRLNHYEKEGWLKYHGFQMDVRPYILACDCFVLPSYHEGMANTNLECSSSGRPIITSNIPGCKEAVVEGSGLLCEPKNVDSLYVAMKSMVEKSREEREQMGKVARKYMEEVFDKKKVVAETIKHLN